VHAVPACQLHDAAVKPELHGRAFMAGAICFDSLDQAVSQRATAAQGLGHPVLVRFRVLTGLLLAGPASGETLAEHRLVGLSAGCPHFVALATVVRVTGVADLRDSAVPVLDSLRQLAAQAVDPDPAVR
jgi:hypothetical protein